jgi:hypothetical protein
VPLKESGALGAIDLEPESVLGDVGGNWSGSHGSGGVSRCAGGCGQSSKVGFFGGEKQPKVSRAVTANAVGVRQVFCFRRIQPPLGFTEFGADGIASGLFGKQELVRFFRSVERIHLNISLTASVTATINNQISPAKSSGDTKRKANASRKGASEKSPEREHVMRPSNQNTS